MRSRLPLVLHFLVVNAEHAAIETQPFRVLVIIPSTARALYRSAMFEWPSPHFSPHGFRLRFSIVLG